MGVTLSTRFSATALKIDDLLKGRTKFSVPVFQRSYSWDANEINEFLQDLNDTYKGDMDEYFFGSMVFTPHEQKEVKKILDGQQRLATVLLFLAALRDVLKTSSDQKDQERALAISDYIYSTDPVHLSKKVKVELNREDRSFFESVITQGLIPEVKYGSHKLMKSAYERFKLHIQDRVKDDKKFAEGILEVILSKFTVIRITANNDLNAHLIFETLNDRGLELSIADLLKNYVFSIGGQHLDEIVSNWKEMVDNVGDHNVSRFLRYFWSSSMELVRKEELYRQIKSSVTQPDEARKFSYKLTEEGSVYSNLLNPTHEFWGNTEIEKLLSDLNVLRVDQVFIVLLALHERFYKKKKEEFQIVLKKLLNFTFRFSTICNLNPNEMERSYSELAIGIRKKEFGIEDVKSRLRKVSPDDETFSTKFLQKEVRSSRLAKYILINISNRMLTVQGEKEKSTDISKVNLEHIIPRRPDVNWQKFLKERNVILGEWKNRLGNMTILYKEYNRKAANKSFTIKKKMYLKSTLPINERLKDYEEFGPTQIEERQQKMAGVAKEIWKI